MRISCLLLPVFLAFFLATAQTAFAQTPQAELEQKIEDCDFTDPEAVFELATWAMSSKDRKIRGEGKKFMKDVLELDEDHEGARTKLGHVKVGDSWYTSKKKAAAARKKVAAERRKRVAGAMKEKGYVLFKNGWIKKTLKRSWNNKWEKDSEDIWHSYEDVMRAKGFSLYKGQWFQMGDEDRKRMDFHRKQTGEDIMIITTPHFIFHTSIPVEFVTKYKDLAEKVYDWYMKTYSIPENRAAMFFGRQAHVWTFETKQQLQDWVTVYSEFYKFDDAAKKRFRERPGGVLDPSRRLMTLVAEQPENLENSLLHQLGVMLQGINVRFREADWASEGFGHLVEELFSGKKFGHVNMSTSAKYANGGGIASKEYNTKDGRPQTKGLVKAGDDIPIAELSKVPLNSLNPDNLAQGFSLTEWLFNHNREKYLKWINALKSTKGENPADVMVGALQAGTGMSIGDLENAWRKYVKSKYK